MGWLDTLNYLNQQHTAYHPPSFGRIANQQSLRFSVAKQRGYDPMGFSRPSAWNALSSGSVAASIPKDQGFDGRFNIAAPFSGGTLDAPKPSRGDVFGSIGGSVGSTIGGGVNIGNVIPWVEERNSVLLHAYASHDQGPLGAIAGAVAAPIDALLSGIKAVSDVAAPLIDAIPNYLRDRTLEGRAEAYRQYLTSGALPGRLSALGGNVPQAALGAVFDLPDSVKRGIEQNPAGADVAKLLDTAPEGRQWSYARGLEGIINNLAPSALLYGAEWLAGGELLGAAKAAAIGADTLGVTAAGAEASAQAARFVKPVAGVLGRITAPAAGGLAARLGGGAASQALTIGTRALGEAITGAGRIQAALLASGMGGAGLSLALDGVARYNGDQAAVDWWDQVNRTTPFSDDPAVQLVTSFTARPLEALKTDTRVVKGIPRIRSAIVNIGGGIGNVRVGPDLATALSGLNGDRVYAYAARMFRSTPSEIRPLLDKYGVHQGHAADMIVGTAADVVFDRIPPEQRAVFVAAHPDGAERAAAVLRQYGPQIARVIEKEPDAIAARWQSRNWQQRLMPGPFDPETAVSLAADYRNAQVRTFQMREQMRGAVVGTVDLLPPQGQALVQSFIDRAPAMVPVQGLDGIQGLIKSFPALGETWQGLIRGDEKVVPKAVVETMLERARNAYEGRSNANPVYTASLREPVLRPSSPTITRDYADAFATNEPTIQAIFTGPNAEGDLGRIQQFLVDKGLVGSLDEAARLTKEDAWQRAADYVDEKAAPWLARGQSLDRAEAEANRLYQRISAIQRESGYTIDNPVPREKPAGYRAVPPEVRAEYNDLWRRWRQLTTLTHDAQDLLVPFSENVPGAVKALGQRARGAAVDATLLERAGRKVTAEQALQQIDGIDGEAAGILAGTAEKSLADTWHLNMRQVEGRWVWTGGLPAADKRIVTKLAAVVSEASRRRAGGASLEQIAADLTAEGDAYVWSLIRRHRSDPNLRLTANQSRAVDAVLADHPSIVQVDDLAGNGMSGQDVFEALARLREARDQVLDSAGSTESQLLRSASSSVPNDYVAAIEGEAGIIYDPEFETTIHPANIQRARIALEDGVPQTVLELMRDDPILRDQVASLARRRGGASADNLRTYVTDPANAEAIKQAITPDGFEAPKIADPQPLTDLDQAIVSKNAAALSALEANALAEPTGVKATLTDAKRIARTKVNRRSSAYRSRILGAGGDLKAPPQAKIMADQANELGRRVLNVILRGDPERDALTLEQVIIGLREIENGNATRMGLGAELQAEGQRVARAILDHAVSDAKAGKFEPGVFGPGTHPALIPEREWEIAREILSSPEGQFIAYDPRDPMGSLQYGLKRPPKGAIVQEWHAVPGLTEEFLSKRFMPFNERHGLAQVRHAFNYVFGPRSNAEVAAAARQRFIERLARQGIDERAAGRVWKAWADFAKESRTARIVRRNGVREPVTSDNALYASIHNIPNADLLRVARDAIEENISSLRQTATGTVPEYERLLRSADYDAAFREATSFVRGHLADIPTLGDSLAGAYGAVVHNKAATTLYYWYRFMLDVRFHAMNFFEAHILGAGRAAFRPQEVSDGLLGATRQYVQSLGKDALVDGSYPFTRSRMDQAYRVFLKEQPANLRSALKGMAAEDPALMETALRQIAQHDPEIRDIRGLMGHTADDYLKAMHRWYSRVLGSSSIDETIDEAIAAELKATPEMAEVYGRLAQANKEHWASVRETFFGNANRSRFERTMNSWLLFWPISYQIKATKWLAKTLFDSVGGLPTGAGGAYVLNDLVQMHQQQLAADPAYRDWFAKHQTLVFIAQMLMPITPGDVGVSLNPVLRTLFFGRSKNVLEMGPVYTSKLVGYAAGELYPDLGSVPGFDQLYSTLTGKAPPKGSAPTGPSNLPSGLSFGG